MNTFVTLALASLLFAATFANAAEPNACYPEPVNDSVKMCLKTPAKEAAPTWLAQLNVAPAKAPRCEGPGVNAGNALASGR